jgi:hypothetical protein
MAKPTSRRQHKRATRRRAPHPACAPAVIPVTRRFLARWRRRDERLVGSSRPVSPFADDCGCTFKGNEVAERCKAHREAFDRAGGVD